MRVCCRCNSSGRCMSCSCVKSGRTYVDCLPSRKGHCNNVTPIDAFVAPVTPAIGKQYYPASVLPTLSVSQPRMYPQMRTSSILSIPGPPKSTWTLQPSLVTSPRSQQALLQLQQLRITMVDKHFQHSSLYQAWNQCGEICQERTSQKPLAMLIRRWFTGDQICSKIHLEPVASNL